MVTGSFMSERVILFSVLKNWRGTDCWDSQGSSRYYEMVSRTKLHWLPGSITAYVSKPLFTFRNETGMSWSCSYQFYGASGLWLKLNDWLVLLPFRFRELVWSLRVGLVLTVEGLPVAAVWIFILQAELLIVFSTVVLLFDETVGWYFCAFSVEKAAVGRLICFA